MNLYRRFLLILALGLLGSASTFAQNIDQLAFFQRQAPTAYRYNPAIIGETGFIGVGGVSLNTRSNLGALTFFYDIDGKTVTALNKAVPTDLFLNQIHDHNYLLADFRYTLFSYGFVRDKSYQTLEVSIRNRDEVTLPKDLFVLLKTGVKQNVYNFSNARIDTDSYAEIAYGYARKLSDVVSIGARAKLLVGMTSTDARISDFRIAWAEEGKTSISFDASLDVTSKKKVKNIGTALHPEFDPKPPAFSLPGGAGLAFDLGVLITPGDYLTLSASVADLGFLCNFYKRGGYVSASFSIDDFMTYYSEDMDWLEIAALAANTVESIDASAEFKATKNHTRVHYMPFSFDLGLKYAMPFYDRLSIGLNGHVTHFRKTSFWDTRLGVDVAPLNWLDLTGHLGYGTYGMNWGFAGSVRIARFRVNLAMYDNFGGTIPYSSKHLKAWNRVLTVGLTYDL